MIAALTGQMSGGLNMMRRYRYTVEMILNGANVYNCKEIL